MSKEKHTFTIDAEFYENGAVGIGGVQYGANTYVAEFFKNLYASSDYLPSAINQVHDQLVKALKDILAQIVKLSNKRPQSMALPHKDHRQQFVNDAEFPLKDCIERAETVLKAAGEEI